MGGIAEKKLPDLFGRPQAVRKNIEELRKSDPKKAQEQLEKSKEFAIKMLLANAKNSDPFAEDSNKSNEMLQTSNLIAQLDSASVQVQKMDEIINAVKNPGFDALKLQGKEVEYDNSKRFFDGKAPIVFDYKIEHNEISDSQEVNSNVYIKDSSGKVVFETKGSGKKGENKFTWDGQDAKGNYLGAGEYTIEIKAKGSKLIDNQKVSFPVRASVVLSGVVKSVEVENGAIKNLILENGNVINKDQVIAINEVNKPEAQIKLNTELMGKYVELDLSRAQVMDGKLEVYFNNHLKNPGKLTVSVFDEKNNLVETLEHTDKIEKETNMVSFSKVGLPNGNYTVKVTVEDKENDNKAVSLNNIMNTAIVGINLIKETIVSIEEKEFKAHNINSLVMQYNTPIQQRANEYKGREVKYRDDTFEFDKDADFEPEVTVKKYNEGNLLSHSLMYIYNEEKELVSIIKSDYEPHNHLTDDSKEKLRQFIQANYHTQTYNLLNLQEKREVSKKIEAMYKEGKISFADNFKENTEKEIVNIKFNWNGKFSTELPQLAGKNAESGEKFRVEFTHIYSKSDSSTYASDTIFNIGTGKVDTVDMEDGELFLNLTNGKRIKEDLIL